MNIELVPSFRVMLDLSRSSFDGVNGVILLLNNRAQLLVVTSQVRTSTKKNLSHTSLNSCASSSKVLSILRMSACRSWTSR